MAAEFQREYLVRLPLPLAQLYSRAYNGKDARSRHDNAFYLLEALVKLSAAPAVAAYLAELKQGGARVPELDRLLAQLALPSFGQWVAILRELSRHFGKRVDAAAHPLGHAWKQLDQKRTDLPGLLALFRRIKNGPDGQPAGDSSCSILDVFNALVQYRNAVFGHGGARVSSFYETELGPLLFPAVNEILAEDVFGFLGPRGSRLVYITEIRTLDADRVEVGLRDLVGLSAERAAPLELATAQAAGLLPNKVCVWWPGRQAPLRLDPLLIYRESDLADEVLMLNRDRNGRQVEYLSYTTGRGERDSTSVEALAELLSTVTGQAIDEKRLQAFAEQSLAETPSVEALFGPSGVPAQQVGNYELLAEIGRGGMGVVYLARQLSLGRLVALKMLPSDLSGDAVALARFQREIRNLARCEHPGIVKVLDSGTLPDGRQFYAMEYVPGSNLELVWRELSGSKRGGEASSLGSTTWARAVLSASEKQRSEIRTKSSRSQEKTSAEATVPELPLPPLPELPSIPDDPGGYTRRVVMLMRDAALAVQAIHDRQIVHRDIKPANLMLTPDGSRLVLMDFGLAKGQTVSLTASKSGGLLGTLRYAAPEQLAAATLKVGPAADVRGLGVTLWELLTRRRLFEEAEDEAQLAQMVHDVDVPRLHTIDPTLDRDLDAIVSRATERRMSDRIQTARQLAEYLNLYLEHKPLPIRPLSAGERLRRWAREHKQLVATCAIAAVLCISLGGAYSYAYYWPHAEYFRAMTQRYRVTEGYAPCTEEERSHLFQALRVTREGRWGPVVKVQVVDSRGREQPDRGFTDLISHNSNEGSKLLCSDEYVYRRGVLTHEIARDYRNREIWTFEYKTPLPGEKVASGGHYMKGGYVRPLAQSGAAFVDFELSPEGWLSTLRFTNEFGSPRAGGDGSFGRNTKFNREGLAIEEVYLGADGKPAACHEGYVRAVHAYDAFGNQTRTEVFDAEGRLHNSRQGWAVQDVEYDRWGNTTRISWYDADRKPTETGDGYAALSCKYDDAGNRIEYAYWDVDGKLTLNDQGIAGLRNEYDDDGNCARQAYFGTDRKPILDKNDGIAGYTAHYEDHRQTDIEFFGVDGKPIAGNTKIAGFRFEYDARGNLAALYCLDVDGQPCVQSNGSAGWTARYDNNDRRIEQTFVGLDHTPTLLDTGYATAVTKYDNFGNLIESGLLDCQRKATCCSEGWAKRVFHYDDDGNLKGSESYDEQQRLLAIKPKVTKVAAGSQGEKLGLEAGDVLLKYNDQELADHEAFLHLQQRQEAAKEMPLVYKRGDELHTVTVQSGALGVVLKDSWQPVVSNASEQEVTARGK